MVRRRTLVGIGVFLSISLIAMPGHSRSGGANGRGDGPQLENAPSVGTRADIDGFKTPVRGTSMVANPSLLSEPSDSGSKKVTSMSGVSCEGCLGYNTMGWTDYGFWETVYVKRGQTVASEVLYKAHNHVALTSDQDDQCYQGSLRFQDGHTRYNVTQTPFVSSDTNWGGNYRWTQSSGHDWWDDGWHWWLDEGNDVCVQF